MPDVIFSGPSGRIEGRYSPGQGENAPVAIILHPHPLGGGSMQDRVTVQLYRIFMDRGFSTLRFNFRGVGRSQGTFDSGIGELSDAASALDWLQAINPEARLTWVAGYSFGAWIAMQLLMRRPEIDGFLAVSPPVTHYDLSFLAPCPASGLILYGTKDTVSPPDDVERIVSRIRTQKNIKVEWQPVEGANHFYVNHLEQVEQKLCTYLDARLAAPPVPLVRSRNEPKKLAKPEPEPEIEIEEEDDED
jgi:alpha/beta superfamily hydrolase